MEQQILNEQITKAPYVKPQVAEIGTVEEMTKETAPPQGSGKIVYINV